VASEVQRKSLLITSGCSNTDSNWIAYVNNNITTWSKIVAEFLDIDHICLGKAGMGNDYITNSVTDAVLDNLDRDITVMVLWTGPNRINVFDYYYYVFPLLSNHHGIKNTYDFRKLWKKSLEEYSKDYYFKFDSHMLNFNLRSFWRLNKFLQEHNIKYHQIHFNSVVNNIHWVLPHFANTVLSPEQEAFQKQRQDRLIEEVLSNRYFDHSFFTHHDWKHNFMPVHDEIFNKDLHIPKDGHPNQKGHELIANEFMKMLVNG
jgi:hypothetical protein